MVAIFKKKTRLRRISFGCFCFGKQATWWPIRVALEMDIPMTLQRSSPQRTQTRPHLQTYMHTHSLFHTHMHTYREANFSGKGSFFVKTVRGLSNISSIQPLDDSDMFIMPAESQDDWTCLGPQSTFSQLFCPNEKMLWLKDRYIVQSV